MTSLQWFGKGTIDTLSVHSPLDPTELLGLMPPPKMQPTFTLDVPLAADELIERIRLAIDAPELRGHTVSAGRCVEFTIEPRSRRFWSPHLSIQVDESQSGSGAQVFGRFSPRPEVWTMFMFVYLIAAMGIAAAGIYGYVQWILGSFPWSLLAMPVGLMIILLIHLASLIGQGLSRDQMVLLRQRFDQAMKIALEVNES